MNFARFRRRILSWFDSNKRDLPWRNDRDPYRVWVSEVMLQQTTVAAVVPYYNRFLEAFPNVCALAGAPEQEVFKLWQGLGYYSRARNLHRAAKSLVEQFGDQLPNDPKVWRELPGVGRYIHGAIMSQAFDRRAPIVEANTLRVICRLFAKKGDPKSSKVQSWLWETAEELLPKKRPGDFNQAMMELGALVCTPNEPRCDRCPVRGDCEAFAKGLKDKIPRKAKAPTLVDVREVAVIVRRAGRVLLVQRPHDAARWAGMWEFPRCEMRPNETIEAGARRLLSTQVGVKAKLGMEVATIRYGVTRFRMTLTALEAKFLTGSFESSYYDHGLWLRPRELGKYPSGTAQRRITQLFESLPQGR